MFFISISKEDEHWWCSNGFGYQLEIRTTPLLKNPNDRERVEVGFTIQGLMLEDIEDKAQSLRIMRALKQGATQLVLDVQNGAYQVENPDAWQAKLIELTKLLDEWMAR